MHVILSACNYVLCVIYIDFQDIYWKIGIVSESAREEREKDFRTHGYFKKPRNASSVHGCPPSHCQGGLNSTPYSAHNLLHTNVYNAAFTICTRWDYLVLLSLLEHCLYVLLLFAIFHEDPFLKYR